MAQLRRLTKKDKELEQKLKQVKEREEKELRELALELQKFGYTVLLGDSRGVLHMVNLDVGY